MTTTATDFEVGLDDDAENWNLRRVYADWLDEQGDHRLAKAQRWMAANRKRPWRNSEGWVWTFARYEAFPSNLRSGDFPESVREGIRGETCSISASRQEAEQALAGWLEAAGLV